MDIVLNARVRSFHPPDLDAPEPHLPPHDADQPAQVYCESCTDNFCDVCFAAQHRKGSRKQHKTKPLTVAGVKKPQVADSSLNGEQTNGHDEEVGPFRHTPPYSSLISFADGCGGN
jgi:hypothetical protein